MDHYPYRQDQYLCVAASLNGGNVLRSYTNFVRSTIELMTGRVLSEQDVWNKLHCSPPSLEQSHSFSITPTLFGERHDQSTSASITNMKYSIPPVNHIAHRLCTALLDNVFDMMPDYVLLDRGPPQKIIVTGTVWSTNAMMRQCLNTIIEQRAQHQLKIEYVLEVDADVGSALFAYEQLELS